MKKLLFLLLTIAVFTAGCDDKNPKASSSDGDGGAGSHVETPPKQPDTKKPEEKDPADPKVNQPVNQDPPKDTRKYRTMKELEDAGIIRKLDRTDTIAGIDANNDGIRDDIELFIEEQNVTDKQKSALRFEAYALQKKLLADLNDESALETASMEGMRSIVCMGASFSGEVRKSVKYSRILEAYTANTRKRAERYIQYNMARSGSVNSLPKGDTCETH